MNIKVAAFTVSEKPSNKPDTFSEEADFGGLEYDVHATVFFFSKIHPACHNIANGINQEATL